MLKGVLRALSALPLPLIHSIGGIAGRLIYFLSPAYASRLKENLRGSGCHADEAEFTELLSASIAESGKALFELIPIWFGKDILRLVQCDDWDVVDKAKEKGRGIIFLTPHLGCFEISALYCATIMPITVLYRKPKLKWIEPLMNVGRESLFLAPADLSGVKRLLKALKKGEAIGLLPDQAPGAGEGEWAEFFGRPAYTMTLAGRLQETGAEVIMAFAERRPKGRGYLLHLKAIEEKITPSSLNRAIEDLVKICPAQYLWSYNRYKVPKGAKPRGAP